jgi:hypothetical protein
MSPPVTDAGPRLATLLAEALAGEPPIGNGVAAVHRRAGALRRRHLRRVVAAGVAAVVLVAAAGYALTAAVVPATARRGAAASAARPTPPADPVLAILRPAAPGLRMLPREPARGDGWRQYTVLDRATGRTRGLIEVSVYAAPGGICFPVLADPGACARPERAGDVEYVRYTDDRDVDWQVHEVIARRLPDGRVVALMATGERGTGDAIAGRPPLTGRQVAGLATDPRLMSAFGAQERCGGGDPACPLLKVPVPVRG